MRLGITQEELGWRADMHRTYIADIERAGRNITLGSIGKLAAALKVPVHCLMQEAPQVETETSGAAAGILLVEPDASEAASIVRTLLRAKIAGPIHVVESAEAAKRHLGMLRRGRRALPRLVILDAASAGAIGLVRRLRAGSAKRLMGVVAMAGARSWPPAAEFRKAGVDAVWSRPLQVGVVAKQAGKLGLSGPR